MNRSLKTALLFMALWMVGATWKMVDLDRALHAQKPSLQITKANLGDMQALAAGRCIILSYHVVNAADRLVEFQSLPPGAALRLCPVGMEASK